MRFLNKVEKTKVTQNQRDITITSAIGKLQEKVIIERIQRYINRTYSSMTYSLAFGKAVGLRLQNKLCKNLLRISNNVNQYLTALLHKKALEKIWHNRLLKSNIHIWINRKCWR